MGVRTLLLAGFGLLVHRFEIASEPEILAPSGYAREREALALGLDRSGPQHLIYSLYPDPSGRMTATHCAVRSRSLHGNVGRRPRGGSEHTVNGLVIETLYVFDPVLAERGR